MARTIEDWIAIFQKQQISGLSETAFCRQNNISSSSFSSRKSTMKRQKLYPAASNSIPKPFIELSPPLPSSIPVLPAVKISVGPMTVSFANGIELDVFQQVIQLINGFSSC